MSYDQNANNPPDPIDVSAGKVVSSSFLLKLSETLNASTAVNNLHLMSAGFPSGSCKVSGSSVSNVLTYRLPIASYRHTILKVDLRVKRSVSNGTITIRAKDATGTVRDQTSLTVDSTAIDATKIQRFLHFTTGGFPNKSTYIDLEVDLEAPAGSETTLETISAAWFLATVAGTVLTPVGNIISIGTNAVASQDPLSAALGDAYIQSIKVLQQRSKPIVSVSACDGLDNTDQAFLAPTVRPHVFRVTPSDTVKIFGFVRVKNSSSSSQEVAVGFGPASTVLSSSNQSTNSFQPTALFYKTVAAGFDGFVNMGEMALFGDGDFDQMPSIPDGEFCFVAVGCLSMVPRAPFGLDDINRTPDIKLRGYSFWSSY